MRKKRLHPVHSCLPFVFLTLFAGACVCPIIIPLPPILLDGTGTSAITLLENNALCYPASLQRIGPEGAKEEVPDRGDDGPALVHVEPGTWIYLGRTPAGTVKAIVQKDESTPLPQANFGVDLEIQPDTHPTDIIPSSDRMSRSASFSFTLLSSGKRCKDPVRYVASCLGRPAAQGIDSGTLQSGKTKKGKGTIRIDAPGTWWITATRTTEDGKSLLASLSFHVTGKPGAEDYASFTSDGVYLDGPGAIAEHLSAAEVIFIGEKHNDAVAHLLEKEILAAVHRKKRSVALTMEMFERDVQPVLDGYLDGHYRKSHFLSASRPWPAYATDYEPMVEYAREHGLPVVAGNAPRRLVNYVTRNGPDALLSLPEEELKWLPPLPYHVPAEGRYVEKLREVFSQAMPGAKEEGGDLPGPRTKRDWIARGSPGFEEYNEMLRASKKPAGMPGGMPGHGGMPPLSMMMKKKGGFPSQSLWDATMAYSISRFLEENAGFTVVQVNGSFHSDEHLGTVEQLLRFRPDTKVAVVSIVPHESFPAFDMEAFGSLGDVIIIANPIWQVD